MKFETLSGSVYEVDKARKLIRRLSGVKDPTPRQGVDGIWKRYESVSVELQKNATIIWDLTTPPLPETAEYLSKIKSGPGGTVGFSMPLTITNIVTVIHPDEPN